MTEKKKIDKLPPELEARLPEIEKYWMDKSLTTEPADRPKMEAAVRDFFRITNQGTPDEFLWFNSPKEALQATGEKYNDIYYNISYGQHDIAWLAYYSVFIEAGVELPDDLRDWFNTAVILTETGWWWAFEENNKITVIMTERPTEIHLDEQKRLHNNDSAALLYADGWGVYAVHGVGVPDWVILHPEDITPKRVTSESNLEVRRIMIERMGWDKFIAESKFKKLDEQNDPGNPGNTVVLYKGSQEIFDADLNFALVTNATPKLNGEIPKYVISVPSTINDAIEAVAWSFNTTKEKYMKMSRAT